jgi:hypothetical protein
LLAPPGGEHLPQLTWILEGSKQSFTVDNPVIAIADSACKQLLGAG